MKTKKDILQNTLNNLVVYITRLDYNFDLQLFSQQ